MTQPPTARRWAPPTDLGDVAQGYREENPVDLTNTARHNTPLPPAPIAEPRGKVADDWTYTPPEGAKPKPAAVAPATWGRIRPRLRMAPGPQELAHRGAVQTINLASPPASRLVVVANEKGGSNKTPAALILSAIISRERLDPVVVADFNPLRGSLALRAEHKPHDRTILDVLNRAEALGAPTALKADLESYLRRQPEGHLVLASTDDAQAMRGLTAADGDTVLRLLFRRWGMVTVDTGNNPDSEIWRHAIDRADVLVVPAAPVKGHLNPAMKLFALLSERDGTQHLVGRSVLLITSPTGDRLDPAQEAWFTDKGVTVAHVPPDPEIAKGDELAVSKLTRASDVAWTRVAGQVMAFACLPSPHDLTEGVPA